MTSRYQRKQELLNLRAQKMRDDANIEDRLNFQRPTDSTLYKFLDTFLENYSWREDIFSDSINLSVFESNDTSDSYKITEESQNLYDTLRWLSSNKYLFLANNHDGTVTLNNVNDEELYELMAGLKPHISPAIVIYNPTTKEVWFNGRKHKLQRGKNLKIFHLLATNQNERLSKEAVWRSIGFRKTKKRDTSDFSKLVANVRTSVDASLEEIQLAETLTLHADVKIID